MSVRTPAPYTGWNASEEIKVEPNEATQTNIKKLGKTRKNGKTREVGRTCKISETWKKG